MKVYDFEAAVKRIKPFLMDYLEDHGINSKKKFSCLHPDHNDSDPSANVVGEDTDSPRVFCHGCGRYMDIFDCAQILEKRPALGVEWVQETLKYLADKYSVDIETKDLTEEQIYEMDTYRAYRAAADLIRATGLDNERHKRFLDHTFQRGWNLETLDSIGVGTVQGYSEFRETLKSQGFTAAFLDEIDLGRKDLFNEDNMIFTWKDERGRPVGFTGRNLKFEEQKREAEEKGIQLTSHKYNNQRTTGLKCNIFQKGRRFYGLDIALKSTPPLWIFEGQTDVITAQVHGLYNCAAIAGNNMRADHVHLLKELGIYDIILCLDGDEAGQKKTKEMLEKQLSGNRDLRVRVMVLPEEHDPDTFIKEYGIDEFRGLACWSAFEWKLNQYPEEVDGYDICHEMIPYMVNEPSPVERDKLTRVLATRTGTPLKAIQQELEIMLDDRAMRRSRERQDVLDKAMYEIRLNPSDAELVLQEAQSSLLEISRKHDTTSFSNEDFVRELDKEKEMQEDDANTDIGFELGPDLRGVREILRGSWSQDVLMAFGGKPNHGKTALLSKIAYELAVNNDDVTVIYHSIDDSFAQVVPRFVCIAEASRRMTVNMVRQPNYWVDTVGLDYVADKRLKGYQRIRELGQQGRLVVKDITHGSTLPFAENLICYYQDKFPDRRVVYILDNIHLLTDFANKDERVRYKEISKACKKLAVRRHVPFLGTVEYTKLPPGVRPNNNNVAESVQFEYDTNFIAHIYNELGDTPDSATLFHKDIDWQSQKVILPRIELIIGKNKITEQKLTLFLDFWPASSDYRHVDHEAVMRDVQAAKEKEGKDGSHLDVFDNKEK